MTTTADLRDLKVQLEIDLKERIERFERESDATVSAVWLNRLDMTGIDQTRCLTVLQAVRVDVDI